MNNGTFMRIIKVAFLLLCLNNIIALSGMQNRKATKPGMAHKEISLLSKKPLIEEMDGATLSMLAQGLLEQQPIASRKREALIKTLLHTAAQKQDPLALYLCGKRVIGTAYRYIPCMYISSIRIIEQSSKSFTPQQLEAVSAMLYTLKEYRLPAEKMLPFLQKRATEAHCSLAQTKEPVPLSLQNAIEMLQDIITIYTQEPEEPLKPWALRACYALGILENIGISSCYSKEKYHEEMHPITIATYEEFEPAIYEYIKMHVNHAPDALITVQKTYNDFLQAKKRLQKSSYTAIAQDNVEATIQDSITCINFLNMITPHIQEIPLVTQTMFSLVHNLKTIIEQTGDYRARCILSTIYLKNHDSESINNAFQCLEPVLHNQEIQSFLKTFTDQSIKDFLKQNAATSSNASFLIGLILCSTKSTRQEAYKYFLMGAHSNHFYSLCCAAAMIRKGYDTEKNIDNAVYYYQKALQCAPSQESKNIVFESIKNMATDNCIYARCLYLLILLKEQKNQQTCSEILQLIESSPEDTFNAYITLLTTHFYRELACLAENGNSLALCLLGYIHYAKAQHSPNLYELHTVLGKLRQGCKTPYSQKLTASIAFTLAHCYRENESNALRLLNIACEHNHEKAPFLRALLRLKQSSNNFLIQDIKLTEQLADQGDLEAQELLAKLYGGMLGPINQSFVPDEQRMYKYLENLSLHGKNNAACSILLAKKLCMQDSTHNEDRDSRAYKLFIEAFKQGYVLNKQECETFGLLAFRLNKDHLALQLLEKYEDHNIDISWIKSILYLRKKNYTHADFEKALQELEKVLVINNDDLDVPHYYESYLEPILQKLKGNLSYNTKSKELFIRLCYANGLEEHIISSHDLLQLATELTQSNSISAWSLLIFLQRKGINIHHSLNGLFDTLQDSIKPESFQHNFSHELCQQLGYLAIPVVQRMYSTCNLDDMRLAIKATHLLASISCKKNLLYACNLFIMAEEATTMLIGKNDPVFTYAKDMGILHGLRVLAEQQNQDALTTLMIYRGYRHIRTPLDTEKINSWLRTSSYITHTYVKDKNQERNTLMAHFYVLIGKLINITAEKTTETKKEYARCFETALSLEPTLAIAQSYVATLNLYGPHTPEKKRIDALKTLQGLADKANPEACFTLGYLYDPKTDAIPGTIQIRKDALLSQKHLNKAHFYIPQKTTRQGFSCSIL